MDSHTKRTALITGASSGIGKAFAKHFAQEGWDIVITARRQALMDTLSKDLNKNYGTQVTVIVADLADPEMPKMIYDEIRSEEIKIDGLVNNAGYGIPGSFVSTSWEQQRDFIQVLVTAVSHLCHLFLPQMIDRRYGRIINVSSLNGLIPCLPGQSLYASAKSFVVSLSHTLQAEVADKGSNFIIFILKRKLNPPNDVMFQPIWVIRNTRHSYFTHRTRCVSRNTSQIRCIMPFPSS